METSGEFFLFWDWGEWLVSQTKDFQETEETEETEETKETKEKMRTGGYGVVGTVSGG